MKLLSFDATPSVSFFSSLKLFSPQAVEQAVEQERRRTESEWRRVEEDMLRMEEERLRERTDMERRSEEAEMRVRGAAEAQQRQVDLMNKLQVRFRNNLIRTVPYVP